MAFHEVRFPTDISYSSAGGPGFFTVIHESDSGAEQRIARWQQPRHQYNVAYGIKTPAQMSALKQFYMARFGAAYGFRYKDFSDFTTSADGVSTPAPFDQVIGTGDGTTTVFQMSKTYFSGGFPCARTILKPVSGTARVAVGTSEVTTGFSIDYTSGKITFSTAPGINVLVYSGQEFDVPVRFGPDSDKTLQFSIDSFGDQSVPTILLMEIRSEEKIQIDQSFPTGAQETCMTGDVVLQVGAKRLQAFVPDMDRNIYLPDPTNVDLGGPVYVICNVSASYTLTVTLHDATTVLCAVAPGYSITIYLGLDKTSARIWYAI